MKHDPDMRRDMHPFDGTRRDAAEFTRRPAHLLSNQPSLRPSADLAQEMRERAALNVRADQMVTGFSRAMGPTLFILCLGGVGWIIVDIL